MRFGKSRVWDLLLVFVVVAWDECPRLGSDQHLQGGRAEQDSIATGQGGNRGLRNFRRRAGADSGGSRASSRSDHSVRGMGDDGCGHVHVASEDGPRARRVTQIDLTDDGSHPADLFLRASSTL